VINTATSALTNVSGSPFPAGAGPLAVTVDPTGKFAYVANNGSHNVSAFSIDATSGGLFTVAGSPFAAGTGAGSVATTWAIQ
jgi:DNA-binding beta-propeller fold protein YncE